MNRSIFKFVSLLAVLFLCSLTAFAQTDKGSITGIVTDASGAVVAGAKVTAVSPTTGLSRNTETGSIGEYTLTALPNGKYNLTIEKEGFAKYSTQAVVDVGSITTVSAKLAITGSSTTVEVSASGEVAEVNTESQTLSTVVTSKQIQDLPTLTRNPYDLVSTSGNVSSDANSNRGVGYAINGARSASTDILLDGGENVNLFTAQLGTQVPLDAVNEFSVLTSNFSAEYGRAGGGVVNVATKSGTNQFHGSLYEFNRVSALATNTAQGLGDRAQAFANGTCVSGQPCSVGKFGFTRNQFGYSVGGPIVKNKLFFFSSTEWIRVRSNTSQVAAIIDPSFLSLTNANTQAYFNMFGKAFQPSLVTLQTSTWGQEANKVPGVNGVCALGIACSQPFADKVQWTVATQSGGGYPQNTWNTVNKIDWNINSKNTLTGLYTIYSEDDLPGTINTSPYLGWDTGQTNYNQIANIAYTHLFTTNLVSTTKLIYNRFNNKQPLGVGPVSPTLYSTTSVPSLPFLGSQLIFPGYNAYTPGNAIPFGGPQNLYQIYEDLKWSRGRHQFSFGGAYIQIRDNRVFGAYENPIEPLGTTFAGSGNTYTAFNSAFGNLINGNTWRFQGAIYPQGLFPCLRDQYGANVPVNGSLNYCTLNLPVGPPAFGRNNRYNDGSWYVNDSWKMTPRFTLNLGLRWEYYGVQYNAPNQKLDSNFYLGPGATIFDRFRDGAVLLAPNSPMGRLWNRNPYNFAPRVGFAWDVFGNGSTSLRGGYGLSYERNFGNVTFNVIQNPPNYSVTSLTSTNSNRYPIFTDVSGPLAGTGTRIFPTPNLRAVNPNIKPAYTEFWSLAIDRQLMKNSVLSLEYVGSKGVHLYSIADMNQAGCGAPQCNGFGNIFLGDTNPDARLNYQYNEINFRGSNAFSNYNGVNVKFQGNNLFNKGLYLNAAYTWSHSIDNLSSTFTDGYASNYMLGYTNGFFPNLDKGNSDFDTRNRFVLSGTWNVPWGNNLSNTVERQLLGGWSVSTIFVAHSGNPYSIYDCTWQVAYSCARWTPTVSTVKVGGQGPLVASNLYTFLSMPVDPNTGSPINTGDTSPQPTCTGLVGVGCQFTLSGIPMTGRNAYQSPGYWNFNFVFAKNFKLTERFQLQFRGEMYNAFNHSNLYIYPFNLDASTTTTIQADRGGVVPNGPGTYTDERRNVQFGLKLTF